VVAEATTLTAGLVIEHWLGAVALMAIANAGLEGVTLKGEAEGLQPPVAMGPFPLVDAPTVTGVVAASVVVTGWAHPTLPAQVDADSPYVRFDTASANVAWDMVNSGRMVRVVASWAVLGGELLSVAVMSTA
jgi:hypothetical protein